MRTSRDGTYVDVSDAVVSESRAHYIFVCSYMCCDGRVLGPEAEYILLL